MKKFLLVLMIHASFVNFALAQALQVPKTEAEAQEMAKKAAEEAEKLLATIENPKTSKKELHAALKKLMVDKYHTFPNADPAGFKIMESGVKKVADAMYEIKKNKTKLGPKMEDGNFMGNMYMLQGEYPQLGVGLAEITRGTLVVMRMGEKLEQARRPLPRKEKPLK